MTVKPFGSDKAKTVLIQAVDDHSLSSIDEEIILIREFSSADFYFMAVAVDDWFNDLSPWRSPAVFGSNAFGDGASKTLSFILDLCKDTDRDYYLGGYSLSALFALWSAYQTDTFCAIAAASPSIWFPGFTDFMKCNDILCNTVYLSLGDREGKTKNKVMSAVDGCIQTAYDLLCSKNINCTLEWNSGNHFDDVEKRCAKAFARILNCSFKRTM